MTKRIRRYLTFTRENVLYIYLPFLSAIIVSQLLHNDLLHVADAVTLLAAFGGSLSAFYFQRYQVRDSEDKTQIDTLRQTQFFLISQYDRLMDLNLQHFAQWKDNEHAWWEMPALIPVSYNELRIDFGKLFFLLNQNADSLLKLQIAQQSFFATIDAFNGRSEFHISQFQTKAGTLEEQEVEFADYEDLKKKIGKRIFRTLDSATSDCFRHIDATLPKLKEASQSLHAMSKSMYPNRQFSVIRE